MMLYNLSIHNNCELIKHKSLHVFHYLKVSNVTSERELFLLISTLLRICGVLRWWDAAWVFEESELCRGEELLTPAFLQCECTDCWVLVYPQYFPHNNCAIFSPCHTLTQWTCQHSGSRLNSALCVLCLNISDISDLEKHLRNQRNTKQLKWSFHQQAVCILVGDLWTIANI